MKFAKFLLLLGCFSMAFQFVLPQAADAKLYTWKDRNGVIRRTYYPPPEDQVWGNKPSHPTVTVRDQVMENKVELYVTDWCPYCKKAIKFFQSRGIPFKVYDIEKDKQAAARKSQLDGGQKGVPLAVINGTRIHGFSAEHYESALNK